MEVSHVVAVQDSGLERPPPPGSSPPGSTWLSPGICATEKDDLQD